MLVLTRKPGEWLRIGDNIRIQINRVSRNRVRLGIEAPADVVVIREEIILDPPTEEEKPPMQQI